MTITTKVVATPEDNAWRYEAQKVRVDDSVFPATETVLSTRDSVVVPSYAMQTLSQTDNRPYAQLDDPTIGTDADVIRAEVNALYPYLDGQSRGQVARDVAGNVIVDADGVETRVLPTRYRLPAVDANGNFLYDAQGRLCYQRYNPSTGFYTTTDKSLMDLGRVVDPTSLDPATFLNWNTATQMEYFLASGTSSPYSTDILGAPAAADGTLPRQVTIGTGSNQITAVLTNDLKHVYILNNLTKTDISRMTLADQAAIAGTAYFKNTLSVTLGMIPTGAQDVATARAVMTAKITSAKNGMTPTITDGDANSLYMNDVNSKVFTDELDQIQYRIDNGSAVFSASDIQAKIDAVVNRYNRAKAFADTAPPDYSSQETTGTNTVSGTSYTYYNHVRSDDNNAGIHSAFRKFMSEEKQILSLDKDRLQVAQTATVAGKKMDVPNLIFLLQLDYNLKDEAVNNGNIEEVNQTNALLRVYSTMQSIVNTVLGNFDTSKTDQSRSINGNEDSNYNSSSLTEAQRKIICMFSSTNINQTASPIETLKGVTRQETGLIGKNGDNSLYFNQNKKNFWDQFSTKLSDNVTLLNQDSQIKMNDINSLQKEKDRHFDLANNSLSKMADMIQNIARSVS